MLYWLEHWDWECPTLFGLNKSELQQVCDEWPDTFEKGSVLAGRAVSNSLGELLWGASALPDSKVLSLFGEPKKNIETFYLRINEHVKLMADE